MHFRDKTPNKEVSSVHQNDDLERDNGRQDAIPAKIKIKTWSGREEVIGVKGNPAANGSLHAKIFRGRSSTVGGDDQSTTGRYRIPGRRR